LDVLRARQPPPYLRLSAGVLMAALWAPPASAQTAAGAAGEPTFPQPAPAPDDTPKNPPVFRKLSPQAQGDTLPPPGQLPDFSDQPAIGAGATGFKSGNTRPKGSSTEAPGLDQTSPGAPAPKPNPVARPPLTGQTALPPVPPASAIGNARQQQNQNRTRRGAPGADAATGAGTVAAAGPNGGVAAPATTVPASAVPTSDPALAVPRTLVRRPVVDDKPFDPLGIRAGSFLLRPAIEVLGGYDTNPARTPGGGRGSDFGIVAPELQVNSNWSRHQLTANLRGSYTAYGTAPAQDRPAFDGKIDGRIDVTGRTRIDLESRLLVATDNPGSPNIQTGLARLPISTDVGGTIGLGQRFNRFDVSLKGLVDRTTYQDSVFTNGTVASNDGRNFDQYKTQLRSGYELTPGVIPFLELDADRRRHDLAVDSTGFDRDSQGRAAKVGSTFELSRILTGELAFGYLERDYADARLPSIRGPTLDASLTWLASALTTFKLTAVTRADESTLAGVSGVFTHELGIEVDHAFRTWLDATLKFTGDRDAYVGIPRQDSRYAAAFDLTYKLNREMQVKGELRREWLTSNQPGNDYQAYVALLGLRLQR
jgi:hypothetical protein